SRRAPALTTSDDGEGAEDVVGDAVGLVPGDSRVVEDHGDAVLIVDAAPLGPEAVGLVPGERATGDGHRAADIVDDAAAPGRVTVGLVVGERTVIDDQR